LEQTEELEEVEEQILERRLGFGEERGEDLLGRSLEYSEEAP
jgi:hypothetical protein